jgi:hypothetical protein
MAIPQDPQASNQMIDFKQPNSKYFSSMSDLILSQHVLRAA